MKKTDSGFVKVQVVPKESYLLQDGSCARLHQNIEVSLIRLVILLYDIFSKAN